MDHLKTIKVEIQTITTTKNNRNNFQIHCLLLLLIANVCWEKVKIVKCLKCEMLQIKGILSKTDSQPVGHYPFGESK